MAKELCNRNECIILRELTSDLENSRQAKM